MIPVLKSFLKCTAFAFASILVAWAFGCPAIGFFIGLVPVMVGFLWVWDYVDEAAKDCWRCGRNQLNGRFMLLSEWYDQPEAHAKCVRCDRKLVQPGDRLYGASIGGRKAA